MDARILLIGHGIKFHMSYTFTHLRMFLVIALYALKVVFGLVKMTTTENNREAKKTLQELKEGVKIEAYEGIQQIRISIGNFAFDISVNCPKYFNIENKGGCLYGLFHPEYITVSTFTEGKITRKGKKGEVRTIRFYEED